MRIKSEHHRGHEFGGGWTAEKLAILQAYLRAYVIALRNKNFRLTYIDAFAGTGSRTNTTPDESTNSSELFPELALPEAKQLLDGSARIALQSEPTFDRYIFIERDPPRCQQLRKLTLDFPALNGKIDIQAAEANQSIRSLCSRFRQTDRAVLFLDPYGMQVEWQTLVAIARTKAIDLWLLFPLGIGLNRLLTRSGKISPGWRRRITTILGYEDWERDFYTQRPEPTLFDNDQKTTVKADVTQIGALFNNRLKTIFAGVAPHPRILYNKTRSPL